MNFLKYSRNSALTNFKGLTMDDEERQMLASIGWTDELLEYTKPSAHHQAVNEMFRLRSEKALSSAGVTALQWLSANPKISVVDLARKLNHGASGFGLGLAIYHEADQRGIMRDVAKQMLIRVILDEFPDGWTTSGDISLVVKIGAWESGIHDYARDSDFEKFADLISRSLAIDDPPHNGWIPEWPNDPIIDSLFDKYWPI